jgi:hypothetical protein
MLSFMTGDVRYREAVTYAKSSSIGKLAIIDHAG